VEIEVLLGAPDPATSGSKRFKRIVVWELETSGFDLARRIRLLSIA